MTEQADTSRFPDGFVWGVTHVAFSWEGAAHEDGKGDSDWDMYARRPGAIANGDTPEVASDGYHRYAEDVTLMKQFGIRAHDFTIAWSRVLPDGTGTPNDKGLDFYDRFVDELLSAGIEPWITLYHFGLPTALYRRGGWLNRDIADWFSEYATIVVDRLSDRVSNWLTFEAGEETIVNGYQDGDEAPGDKVEFSEVLNGAHNVLLAHGKGVQAIRAAAKQPLRVGTAFGTFASMPASDADADIEAARTAMFSVPEKSLENASWWMDPIHLGRYPEEGLQRFGPAEPPIQDGDMATICQPLDFFGTGIYSGQHVRASQTSDYELAPRKRGQAGMTPDAMYWGPRFLHERYATPIVITEHGMWSRDWVSLDGAVHDPRRIDYTRRCLLELERLIADNVPIEGYFHWTWVDNFECSQGFAARYGMVYCDFETLERTPKDSASWYRDVILTNGASLHPPITPVT